MLGKAFEKREKAGKEPGLEPEPELEGFGVEPSRSKGGGSGSGSGRGSEPWTAGAGGREEPRR